MRKPQPKKLDWWRPIETGGSLSCKECPQFLKQRDETYSYAGTVRALESEIHALRSEASYHRGEVARYQIELDSARQELEACKRVAAGLVDAGTHPTAHDYAVDDYWSLVNPYGRES
jgi:hypothetical protein